jgi:hypothetical protein
MFAASGWWPVSAVEHRAHSIARLLRAMASSPSCQLSWRAMVSRLVSAEE